MFYALDEYPSLGSKGLSLYPDEWDDQQDMSPTRVLFNGVWFEYYRGLSDLLSAGGVAQIGVRTAPAATFNGYNFNPQRALNPVIVNNFPGAPAPVAGGVYNDMRAVVYDGKIRLFVAIYGNPSGSNRTVIFESVDGFTFTYVGEAQKDAAYLGRTIGALANVSGTLVSLVSIADGAGGGNGRQKWISTDGGLTWLDRGLAIHVGDEGDWNGLNYVGGTMQLIGDYYVALLPGMPFIGNNGGGSPYLDWPEAVGAFRLHKDYILLPDMTWQANASNPLFIAGPTHNALWHMALFEDRGTTYSTVETWGIPGFENIGSADTRALRTTPYYGTEAWISSSQLYELRMASRHWLTHWTSPVVADGAYTLRHVQSKKFVTVVDGQPVLTGEGVVAEFNLERELGFYTISNDDLCLSAIDDLMQTGFEFVENPGALDNVIGQWWIMPWEDRPADQPQLVVLTNRYSRLAAAMPRDTETEGAPLVQAPFLGHASMVFELAPVVRAGTDTAFPDPENPMLNIELPAGDLVGTTASQQLENKTLKFSGHVGTIAQLITYAAAGDFDTLPDNSVVWAGGCPFLKEDGAEYEGLPVGFTLALDYVHPKWWGGTWNGTANDTAVLRRAHAFANAVRKPITYAGIESFGIERAARISVQTSWHLAGAKWRFVDGLLSGTSFNVTDVTAAFVVEDPDTPAVVATVTVGSGTGQIPAASLVAGSKRPTAGYWDGPGYARIASGGAVYAAARYLGGGTMVYEQPFWLSPEGLAVWPLEADLSADTTVTITRRANSAHGQIEISGIVLDVSTCNCQTLLEIARNQVAVHHMSFVGAMPAYHRHGLIRVLDAGAVTLDDMPLHAFDNDPNVSSRPFNFIGGAEIRLSRIIATDGWGQMGTQTCSGVYLSNCSINRIDCHQWGFNFFATDCSFEKWGGYFGTGGGWWKFANCQFNDAKAALLHREDFDGATFNMNIVIVNPGMRDPDSTSRLVDWSTYPVGSPAAVIKLPNTIVVTNAVRKSDTGVANTATITRVVSVAVAANAAGVYTSRQVAVDGVYPAELSEVIAVQWPALDLTPLPGGKTQITVNNVIATKIAGAIDRCTVTVPNQVLAGAPGAPFILRASDCQHLSVQAPSANSSEFIISTSTMNRLKTGDRQVRMYGGRLKDPVYFSPETKAPVGGARSGTADLYTSIHGVDVEASEFTFASASVLSGVVIPAALSPTMPTDTGTGLLVTHAQALTGWAQNGFL